MQVLAFLSKQRGMGTSTLACHVAVQAQLTGHGPVTLTGLRHDPILSNWSGLRQGRHPLYEETSLADLGSVLEKQDRAGVRLSVIDCAFEDEETLFRMAGAADLVVVPTHAETAALEQASGAAAIAEQQRKPFIFVMNAAEQDADTIGNAAMYLAQHGTVSPVIMPQNDDLGTSIRMGQTIVELNRTSPASSEVVRLWDYLLSRLDRVPRQATHSFRASLPNLPVAAEPERKALPARVLHLALGAGTRSLQRLPLPIESSKSLWRDVTTTPGARAFARTLKAQWPSVIGPRAEIVGNLESTGDIHFHAHYEGEIRARTLRVCREASIRGLIIADAVTVEGAVRGRIRAAKVILAKGASVSGEVLYEKLVVRKGAILDGHCRRVEPVPALAQIKALESA